MQFKHPEILYALFLLLIPVFIHLFQLRRFKKVAFTNVAFLKKVTIETRKSNRLKKWLTLLLRLLALASIILAFAQPFLASKTALNSKQETVIYIDNSFSMQAKGQNGVILKQALQQLYNTAIKTRRFNWFTNNHTKRNSTLLDFKEEILKTGYSYQQLPLQQVLLKAKQLFSKDKTSIKRLVLISDFQIKDEFPKTPENVTVYAIQLKPISNQNISIDTLFVESKSSDKLKLKAVLSAQKSSDEIIPVSVYNNDKLLAKSSVTFANETTQAIEFEIDNNTSVNGKIRINEPTILYDNDLYFSISKPEKINVLAINQAKGNFLNRIFTPQEFNFIQQSYSNLDYNLIESQHFIILNELETIPVALQNSLLSFSEKGGSIFIIPSQNSTINTYNSLFLKLKMPTFSEKIVQERKITKIEFNHPVYRTVFEKQVTNFQYPKVQSFYKTTTGNSTLLRFEDNTPFIINNASVYCSTAAFNQENSNFKNSPLIVPTLYNIAKQSIALPQLYYLIGRENTFSISTQVTKDQVVTIRDSTSSFIPLQKSKLNKVFVTTNDIPEKATNYSVYKDTEMLQTISYNYPRDESNLVYQDISQWENVQPFTSVTKLFSEITNQNTIIQLWKWFVMAAFLFLLLEMLVLKFFKQ